MALLECVPNVSEGRRKGVIERLAATLSKISGVCLADISSDLDHNRSVFTLLGDGVILIEAMVELFATARQEIDLTSHSGVHPRLGVVDVIPFVPLREATMGDAVAAARELGRRLGETFGGPIFLYGEATERSELRQPAAIRRLTLDELAESMTVGGWQPDFGAAEIDPSCGVTLVGARDYLIAFNATLETPEVAIARRIARAIRASSGGLEGVQALGFYLASDRRAQVSVNIIDTEATSMYAVLEEIRSHAADDGTRVVDCEIVGLVPAAALDLSRRDSGQTERLGAGRRIEDFL